jgi:hypothetical protein
MPTAHDAAQRAERSVERLDRLLSIQSRREMHAIADSIARRDAERAERDEALRDRELRHADSCRKHAQRYDGAFAQFGEVTPQRINGEWPGDYRRRLFTMLQRRIALDHRLAADVRADDLGTSLIGTLEPELLAAAAQEAERPSRANLPRDGSMIERNRVDARSGARETTFFGRESFIRSMGQAPRRVVGIFGSGGRAVWPPSLQAAGVTKLGLMRE